MRRRASADDVVEDVELRIYEPPRFFEAFLRGRALHRGAGHHRPHLRDLPGGVPDERVHGDGGRLRRRRAGARSAPCAGCSTAASGSRATRCTSTCCTRRTSSATTSAIDDGARPPRASSSAGCGSRRPATQIDRAGRRPRDPPDQRARRRLLPRADADASCGRSLEPLREAREIALETVRWVAGFDFPDFEQDYEFVALRPARASTRSSAGGSSPAAASTSRRRVRRARRRGARDALQRAARAAARRAAPTWSGRWPATPSARPAVAAGARGRRRDAGLEPVCRNPFRSIVVRARRARATPATRRAAHRGLRAARAARAVEVPPRRRRRPRRDRGAARACSTTATRSTPTARSSTPGSCRRPRRTSAQIEDDLRGVRRRPTLDARRRGLRRAASRRSATTTPASPARPTSSKLRCGARLSAGRDRRRQPPGARDDGAGLEVARAAARARRRRPSRCGSRGRARELSTRGRRRARASWSTPSAPARAPGTRAPPGRAREPLPAEVVTASTHLLGPRRGDRAGARAGTAARRGSSSTASRGRTSRRARGSRPPSPRRSTPRPLRSWRSWPAPPDRRGVDDVISCRRLPGAAAEAIAFSEAGSADRRSLTLQVYSQRRSARSLTSSPRRSSAGEPPRQRLPTFLPRSGNAPTRCRVRSLASYREEFPCPRLRTPRSIGLLPPPCGAT